MKSTRDPMTRCIILTDAEARAAHEGTLTELRRVIGKKDRQWWAARNWEQDDDGWPMVETDQGDWMRLPSPYAPGDVLAVRETYCLGGRGYKVDLYINYRAGGYRPIEPSPDLAKYFAHGWLSPATMPRWAIRTSLLVERVGVERLQAITEEDAERCGHVSTPCDPSAFDDDDRTYEAKLAHGLGRGEFTATWHLRREWDATHKPGEKWADNPYTWVYGVRKDQQ